jgi:hypothetical protein
MKKAYDDDKNIKKIIQEIEESLLQRG